MLGNFASPASVQTIKFLTPRSLGLALACVVLWLEYAGFFGCSLLLDIVLQMYTIVPNLICLARTNISSH